MFIAFEVISALVRAVPATSANCAIEFDVAVDGVLLADTDDAGVLMVLLVAKVDSARLPEVLGVALAVAVLGKEIVEAATGWTTGLAVELAADAVAAVAPEVVALAEVLVEAVPVERVGTVVLGTPKALTVPTYVPCVDEDGVDDCVGADVDNDGNDHLVLVDEVGVVAVAAVVVNVVEGIDADVAKSSADEPDLVEGPFGEDVCVDAELVDEPLPAVSASAIAGLLVIAVPIPSAIARAPIRPMYRDADVVAVFCDGRW